MNPTHYESISVTWAILWFTTPQLWTNASEESQFYSKTLVLLSLFNNVAGLKINADVFLWNWWRLPFFAKHLRCLLLSFNYCSEKMSRSSHQEVFCKKGVLRHFAKFTGKQLCQSLFFNKAADQACNFIKKETLAQVFSSQFCKISKSTFSYRSLPLTASEFRNVHIKKNAMEYYFCRPK